jgi:bacterial regulatory proteins, luxR family
MTVDELKARRKELSAKKKALELDGSDAIALCMVEEELMDVNAHLRALTPGQRIGSKGGRAQVGRATDHQQFTDWAQEDQNSLDEDAADVRTIAMKSLANGKNLMTARQWEVLQLWASGMPVKVIAEKLGVHKATASRILGRARRALNDVVDLQAAAARGGIRQDAVMSIDMSQEAVLRVVLPTLTETQIVYLYLYYGEFLSCAEIARLLEYDKSTVSRTLHRAVERITRAFHTTRVQLTGLHALGELAYQFYVANHDLDKLPEAPTITQPYWGRSTLIQQFHVIPEVLQNTEDAQHLVNLQSAQAEPVHKAYHQYKLHPLKPFMIITMERFESQPQGGPRFGKLLSTLLERRRVRKIKQPVIFDWLCRIFGSFVGWLGKKR